LDPEIVKILENAYANGTYYEVVPTLPEDVQANLQAYFDWIDRPTEYWWLRTPYVDSQYVFHFINEMNTVSAKSAFNSSTNLGVSFAFCF